MTSSLAGQRILLCVCGGIAAYKAIELVRRLREAGAEVQVAMTENAKRFVGAASLQAVSGLPVRDSLWDAAAEASMGHIELARWADRILVAPATADMLARLAHGFADDLVTTLCLATAAPVAIAPAMNNRMWLHPATQANLRTLQARGVGVIGPDHGAQACGEFGPGRLAEPPEIVAALAAMTAAAAARHADFAGCRVLISAGPTYEDIDPVRFIGNRSSGKMGFAIAAAAARRGAEVVMVAGPVSLPTPAGVGRADARCGAGCAAGGPVHRCGSRGRLHPATGGRSEDQENPATRWRRGDDGRFRAHRRHPGRSRRWAAAAALGRGFRRGNP
jgi:phosphopantothenoylcysteine decarboxylase/phosphopantothenate--cysteine ligase